MHKLLAILKKEFIVISRDIHSVVVLFILPTIFILLMSLAMRDLYQSDTSTSIKIMYLNNDSGNRGELFLGELKKLNSFNIIDTGSTPVLNDLKREMVENDIKFALTVNPTFTEFIKSKNLTKQKSALGLKINPTVNPQLLHIVKTAIVSKLKEFKTGDLLKGKDQMLHYVGLNKKLFFTPLENYIEEQYLFANATQSAMPTSVQQNVPAWLLFAMYLIVIPIASTFITERNHGTMTRYRSMNITKRFFIFGKMIPFFLINLIQAALMLLIGIYIVPLLGGDSLQMGNSITGLLLIISCNSFCAISLALLIALSVKTFEQGAAIGGFGNVILGAIGGIMVPKFVMPEFMQKLSLISPMGWGLEGFFDIFLRNGNLLDVLPECGVLLLFGAIFLSIALLVLRNKLEV